jgi:hypothetical protein
VALTPLQEWKYWDGKLIELRRGQLGTVQAAATAWSTLFGGLLAVFGTIAFAGGLTGIEELPGPAAVVAKGLTLVAALAAASATWHAAHAAQSMSLGTETDLTAMGLRQRMNDAAAASLIRLQKAKGRGMLAAVAVLVGSAMILIIGKADKPADAPPAAVVVVDGRAVCGKLQRGSEGGLSVAGTELTSNVSGLTVVAACP